jgi:glycosyltransferase involved in cell wall biosynthesis
MPKLVQPLVCICVPTYNSALTIRETLLSITAQSYSNLKIKIVDNASTDDTAAIVDAIADDRIEFYQNLFNVGPEDNFNRCILLAEGKYMAIFHADDVYEPNMVQKQVAFLETHPTAGGVFTEATLIDERGYEVGEIRQPVAVANLGPLFNFKSLYKAILKHSNFLICPSFMARTEVYQHNIKCWRGEIFGSSADLDVWLRVLQHYDCGILPELLMRYRISTAQGSSVVRHGTDRADFFRVIDHYQAQQWVTQQLEPADYLNLTRLERRDRVMRSVNYLLIDNLVMAKELCCDVLSRDALCVAVQSKRGLAVLILGIFVYLSIALGFTGPAKIVLTYLKRKTNR